MAIFLQLREGILRRAARRLRGALKGAAAAAAALLLGCLLAAILLVARPEWFIDSGTLAYALKTFGRDYRPRWDALELRLRSRGLLDKDLRLAARGFCVEHEGGRASGCFEEFQLDAGLSYSRDGARLRRIGLVARAARPLRLEAGPPAAAEKRAGRAPGDLRALLARPLRGTVYERLEVDLASFELRRPGSLLRGRAKAALAGPAGRRELRGSGRLETERDGRASAVDGALSLATDAWDGGPLNHADGRVRLDAGANGSLRASARVEQSRSGRLKGRLEAALSRGTQTARLLLEGERTPSSYTGSGRARLRQAGGALAEARLEDCRFTVPVREGGAPSAAQLSCRHALVPGSFGATTLKELAGTLALEARFPGRDLDRFSSRLAATLAPTGPKTWYEFEARLEAEASGRFGALAESLALSHDLTLDAAVPRFSELVSFLSGTRWAVPAPFHVLDGAARLSARSRGRPRRDRLEASAKITTDLSSRRQKLKIRASAEAALLEPMKPERSLAAKAEATLEDVSLDLPYLEIGALPRVLVDKRIAPGAPPAPAAKRPPALPVKLSTRVATGKPLTLRSNLALQPIPISVDLRHEPPGGPVGTVEVHRFELELFRQKAVIERLRLTQGPGQRFGALDGLVLYQAPDVLIKLQLIGPVNKPRVELLSEPPLDKQQIVALLLFGKAPSELDPDQTATVGNTETALASGAFGIGSLFLFASTPVEHVGYDPATKTYSVRFRLPGGASMELGSGLDESRHLRLRKRLSRHWAVETELRDQQQEGGAVTTFLEWFNRY